MVKNSGVPPATCVPWSVFPFAVAVLPYSQMSAPICFACGTRSRSWRTCDSVTFLRAWISGEKLPNCTAGQRWSWKTSAPSWPSCLSIFFRSPLSSAIIATTVKTPMTMPSSVRPERSLCPFSESSARRRSSTRAVITRRTGDAAPPDDTAGAWRQTSLIAQRLDRLQQRRRQRRPESEPGAQYRGADHSAEHHARIHLGRERRDEVDQRGRTRRERNPHHSADHRHHHRLAEELPEDGRSARPDRAPDADLPRALLHGDEQDVHDADPRHDGGDDPDQDSGDVGRHHHLVETLEQLVLPVDGEVLLLIRRQVARVAHHRGDLVLRFPHLAFGGDDRDDEPPLAPE